MSLSSPLAFLPMLEYRSGHMAIGRRGFGQRTRHDGGGGGTVGRGEPLDGTCGMMDGLDFFVTRCFLSFSSRRKNRWVHRVRVVCFLRGRVGEAGGIFFVRAVWLG
jgi:hypothetical protein